MSIKSMTLYLSQNSAMCLDRVEQCIPGLLLNTHHLIWNLDWITKDRQLYVDQKQVFVSVFGKWW